MIAVLLGALLGGERVIARSLAALALVIMGVVASRLRSAKVAVAQGAAWAPASVTTR